jgi:hypothetical protein
MPVPVAAIAIGGILRGAAGVAARGAARGAMTGARFGARGVKGAAKMSGRAALLGGSLSSSQFNSADPGLNNPGTAVRESLRFGADIRVGTDK